MIVDSTQIQTLGRRLSIIEGQIRGIRQMLETERRYGEIVTQLTAARSALDQVSIEVIANHLDDCMQCGDLAGLPPSSKPLSDEELVKELRTTLSRLIR